MNLFQAMNIPEPACTVSTVTAAMDLPLFASALIREGHGKAKEQQLPIYYNAHPVDLPLTPEGRKAIICAILREQYPHHPHLRRRHHLSMLSDEELITKYCTEFRTYRDDFFCPRHICNIPHPKQALDSYKWQKRYSDPHKPIEMVHRDMNTTINFRVVDHRRLWRKW